MYGGCFRASCEGLRPHPGRRWLGGLTWDCRRLVRPVLFFFFWLSRRCRVGRVGVQQLSIPGSLPASLSHVLNAARWVGWERVPPGLSHPLAAGGCCSPPGFGSGAGCREGKAVPEHGDVSFPLALFCVCSRRCSTRYFAVSSVGAGGYLQLPLPARPGAGLGRETSQVCEPVIKPHVCQEWVSFPGPVSSPAGWVWCGAAGLKLPTRGVPPAGQDASRSISPPSCPAPSSSPLPSLSQQRWKRWTLSQEPFLMAGSLHEATRSWAQAHPLLGLLVVWWPLSCCRRGAEKAWPLPCLLLQP